MSDKNVMDQTQDRTHQHYGPAIEKRTATRSDTLQQVSLVGNFGNFKGYAINMSFLGALVEIENSELGIPSENVSSHVLNQTINDQFRRGLLICFKTVDFTLEADVAHASFNNDPSRSSTLIGCKFKRPLSREECACLQVDPPPPGDFRTASATAQVAPKRIEIRDGICNANIYELMHQAVNEGATDLHIKVGGRPRIRISGDLVELGEEVITQESAHLMALELMTSEQVNRFELEGDLELTYSLEETSRFRINVFRQRGYTGIAIRCIPNKVPTIEELGLLPITAKLAEKSNGLVLVTGPTGSGKSTSLAALINHINQTRSCNIVTMEDPIEYIHQDQMAQINQREVGDDVPDFATALRRGLRQDPNVIMVGELRDLESISLALTAAETGHLVFATLHTTSAAQTPARIIDVFPAEQQSQIRIQLADSLQGVISQILLPGMHGGLVLAQEILVVTEGVRAMLRDNKTSQVDNMLQTGAKEGMVTLDTSLNRLVQDDLLDYEVAVAKANVPKLIKKPRVLNFEES